jgi:hypothetical protein
MVASSPPHDLDITEDPTAGPALVTIKNLPILGPPKSLQSAQSPTTAKEVQPAPLPVAVPLPVAPKQLKTVPPVITDKEPRGPTTPKAESSALLGDPPAPEPQLTDRTPADLRPITPMAAAVAPAAPTPTPEIRSSPTTDVTTEARRTVETQAATASPPADPKPPTPAVAAAAPTAPTPEIRSSPKTNVTTKAGAGSTLGIGFGGLTIRLDGARSRTTEQPTAMVSGRIVLGTAPRIVLQVNDGSRDITADGRTFQAPATLKPGPNVVRVIASDGEGHESEDVVSIEYRPPLANSVIVLTSPQDGHTLTASDVPIVVMEGEVDNPYVTRVRLVANDRRITVPVVDRRFRQVIPVLEPLVRLRAEIADAPDGGPASATVTVRGPGAPTAGVFVMNWTATPPDARPEVIATFRARSDRPDMTEQSVTVESVASRPGAPKDVFLLRKMHPGVYTFVMRYAGAAGAIAMPLLYLGRAGAPTAHPLAPLTLAGSGRTPLAKILLPHGVLWDQDDWFSGKSESVDTLTKFRLPEGVTWTERKAPAK